MGGANLRIRPATPDDARAIAEIHVRTWQSAYKGFLPDASLAGLAVADRFRLWQRLLGDPDAPVSTHVAELRGQVAGFCSVGPPRDPADQKPDVSELYTIYVRPESQGRGVGFLLLTAAERTMRDWGAVEGVLWVLADNTPAKTFYVRQGWQADGTVKTDTIFGIEIREARYRKTFRDGNE